MGFNPPKSPGAAAKLVALGALIAVLTPIWFADRAASRVRTRRRTPSSRSIPRFALGADPRMLSKHMDAAEPRIITDLYERLPFDVVPDVAGLRGLAASVSKPFGISRFRADAPYFLYVGDYGAVRQRRDQVTLEGFLDEMFGPSPAESDTCTYALFSVNALEGSVGRILEPMATALGSWSGRRPDVGASGIWIGSTGAVTPLHHDAWTGLLFQPHGSKRVVMYGPVDRDNVYLNSPFQPTGRWSALPPGAAGEDLPDFPRTARATRYEAILSEGEALFIPPFWSHEVEALEPNISIPFRFATRTRDRLNPGFLRPAVEVFHGKYLAGRD